MKKTIACILVVALLLCMVAMAASADNSSAPIVININFGEIQVGQMVSVFDMWNRIDFDDEFGGMSSSTLTVSGDALRKATADQRGSPLGVFGAKEGQGTATTTSWCNRQFVFHFTVVPNENVLVRNVSITTVQSVSIEEILTEFGYTFDGGERLAMLDTTFGDVEGNFIFWDVLSSGGWLLRVQDNQISTQNTVTTGKGQVLVNMNDGQVILINIIVEPRPITWWQHISRSISSQFYFWFLASSFFLPLLLFTPLLVLLVPVSLISETISFFRGPNHIVVNPPLVFE